MVCTLWGGLILAYKKLSHCLNIVTYSIITVVYKLVEIEQRTLILIKLAKSFGEFALVLANVESTCCERQVN